MRTHMNSKVSLVALSFLLLILCSVKGNAEMKASPESKLKADLEIQLVSKKFLLRKSFNVGGSMYVKSGTNEYILWQKPGGLFPIKENVADVTVTKIRFSS